MPQYRCYFQGRNGQFLDATAFIAEMDERAIYVGRNLAERAETHPNGFEIWQEGRFVYSEKFTVNVTA